MVENRPGASGSAAYNGLLQSTPTDGHAFILSDGAMLSISPHINKETNYKLGKDLLPVALVGRSSLYLVAHPKTGVNTLQEFVAAVRKKPSEYTYGSSGIGSNHHLTMEALKAALNLNIRHVPYRGSGQSTPALVSGQVDFSIAAMPSIAGFVQNGQVKVLASNAANRSPLAPDVPLIAELVQGFDFATILTVLAAAGTPAIAIDRVSRELAEVVKLPDVVKRLYGAAVEPIGGGPSDLGKALEREIEVMARAVQAAQLKAE
ncbi:MAG: tripartite tricarboxylate transporter substrate binding protein [Betaproteobacteria bacterium]|nr:tripartite tricarboxylate transporter substrate binding protein [Betaproteobacteria bacterium]